MFIWMRQLGLIVSFLVFFCLAGCSQENDTTAEHNSENQKTEIKIPYGGTYRIPLELEPVTLDPAFIEDRYSLSVAYQIFEGLVRYGPYLSVLPAVAKNWQVEDEGRTIQFVLRDDVHFHHGRRVTARDVIFSLERIIKVKPAPSILPHLLKIKGAQKFYENKSKTVSGLIYIDDDQLTIHLIEPYAPLLSALAMYQSAIVPEDIVKQMGEKFGRSPVGCGAFKFTSWEPADVIRLERYSDYYSGPSYLENIEYQIYPGGQRDRILADFQSGTLQEMPVFGAVRQKLSETKQFQWVQRPSLSLLFYGINLNHPQMKDPRLRKALSQAIDRSILVKTVYNGQFEPAYSVLPPGMPGHNPEDHVVVENLAHAAEIIQQIGAEGTNRAIEVEIVSASQSAFAKAEFGFIEAAWNQIGVATRIKYLTDWSEFEKYINSDAMQIFRYVWTANMPDPDDFTSPLFGSDSPVNYTRYNNPEIDHLLRQAGGMVDPVERSHAYQQIEKKVMQTTPIIPLFYLSIDRVYQPSVKGITISALGAHTVRLHRVWLDSAER